MKKSATLILMFFLLYFSGQAQGIFQTTYGGTGFSSSSCFSIEQTSDSGYIAVGNFIDSGNFDGCITKTNLTGAVEWSETCGGLRAEIIFSVNQTTNGSFAMAGISRSFSADSLNECYILKLNSSGTTDWEKIYGSLSGAYETGAHHIRQTADGGFIIGGYKTEGTLYGMLYLKTDASGTISWGKYIDGSLGTYGVESIFQTMDGGYIITGNGGKLIKTNPSGNIIWSKSYINGAMSFSAQQTTDGGYMLAGETNAYGSGGNDMFLIKTDSSGNAVWCKTFGGTLSDELRVARQTSDGGYILLGNTYSFGAGGLDIYAAKTDASGNLLWSKTYGSTGSELGYSIRETSEGGFIIAGQTGSFGSGTFSAYVIRTDSTGTSGCNEANAATLVTNPVVVAITLNETATTFIPDTHVSVSALDPGLSAGLLCLSFPNAIAETDNTVNEFSIAPNPAAEYFTVVFDRTMKKGKIEMYDVLGEKLLVGEINDEIKKVINIEKFSNGIYFVKLSEAGKYYSRKIVVEHK